MLFLFGVRRERIYEEIILLACASFGIWKGVEDAQTRNDVANERITSAWISLIVVSGLRCIKLIFDKIVICKL